jgi:hypothetical protein
VLAPNQICQENLDAPVDLSEQLTRRDWRLLLRGADRERRYLTARAQRPTSHPNGADAQNLERLARLIDIITTVAGE